MSGDAQLFESLAAMQKSLDCDHVFHDFKPLVNGDGLTATCKVCRCRFTSWPGGSLYDEMLAQRRERADN